MGCGLGAGSQFSHIPGRLTGWRVCPPGGQENPSRVALPSPPGRWGAWAPSFPGLDFSFWGFRVGARAALEEESPAVCRATSRLASRGGTQSLRHQPRTFGVIESKQLCLYRWGNRGAESHGLGTRRPVPSSASAPRAAHSGSWGICRTRSLVSGAGWGRGTLPTGTAGPGPGSEQRTGSTQQGLRAGPSPQAAWPCGPGCVCTHQGDRPL